MDEAVKIQLKTLPKAPGVYQYYDKKETLLYIGKAKNLQKRVASYFTKTADSAKTRVLVSKIHQIKHIVVETETDALLLENNLIKKYQPRYNVLLKDDKTYPWICIKKERFPRVFMTRKVIKDGSEYFGPYPSTRSARALMELIKEIYPLRTCAYDLSRENIKSGKYKVCLDYHLGICKGPCASFQTESDYQQTIQALQNILKGNFKSAVQFFKNKMLAFAERLEFEEAQKIKERLDLLENYQSKSTVVSPSIDDVDVFSIVSDAQYGYVNFLKVANGSIIQSHTLEVKKKLQETDEELLQLAVVDLRRRFHSVSKEVFLPFFVSLGAGIKVKVPKLGDKKRLVELSLRNAKYHRQDRIKKLEILDPERHTKRVLAQMKKDLRLKVLPQHIECFDNSNIQGTHPVAACVVFKNAKPSKKDYRHFNIKTVEGPDDFASMKEVVYRRYKRLLATGAALPQLVVIDGGKGQLSAALKGVADLGLQGEIAFIGIAKRLEEIYRPGDSVPLYLDKTSETLKVVQFLRNEAHRFGISHHRNRRSKTAIQSELTQISGVGAQTATRLLRVFKSVKRIKEADLERLAAVVGINRAKKIREAFDFSKTH